MHERVREAYSPEAHGAECWHCPLREARIGAPVPPELAASSSPLAVIVGANPGPEEVKRGRPFVGPSGVELMQGLAAVGAVRAQFHITNAILCCPPGGARGALERFNHDLQQTNKRRERRARHLGLPYVKAIPSPLECCRPRLLAEIAETPRVITLGGAALHSVLGRPTKVMDARGGPREVALGTSPAPELTTRVLPTLHPSFVISSRRWRGPFRADLARAVRWFTSGLAWRDPLRIEAPTPRQLEEFLVRAGRDPFTTCDLETFPGFPEVSHYDPLYDKIGLVGIGTADGRTTAIVPFRSIEGCASKYTKAEQAEIVEILKEYLTTPRFVKDRA